MVFTVYTVGRRFAFIRHQNRNDKAGDRLTNDFYAKCKTKPMNGKFSLKWIQIVIPSWNSISSEPAYTQCSAADARPTTQVSHQTHKNESIESHKNYFLSQIPTHTYTSVCFANPHYSLNIIAMPSSSSAALSQSSRRFFVVRLIHISVSLLN